MNSCISTEERALIRGERIAEDDLQSLQGWYPVAVGNDGLWWRFFGEKRFSEPFFHNTVSSLNRQHRLCLRTDFDMPNKFDDAIAPAAFIFHISRCGSTLLTQLLASLPECIVMSEPPAIDSLLRRYHAGMDRDDAEKLLRKIVSAMGQKRYAEERHLFVKLDSWHIASLPLFRRAFPDTPFLFLYREPDKVLSSHRRQRGRQMVPGLVEAAMPPLDFAPTAPGDLEGYCANMLAHFFDSACRHADELIFINYSQLPHLVWNGLLEYFAVSPSPAMLETMKSRSAIHSKNGGVFSGDPQGGKGPDSLCTFLQPRYEKLERLRLKQSPFGSG